MIKGKHKNRRMQGVKGSSKKLETGNLKLNNEMLKNYYKELFDRILEPSPPFAERKRFFLGMKCDGKKVMVAIGKGIDKKEILRCPR